MGPIGPIKAKKLQAMKNYKKAQFLNNLLLYSITSLISCLFCSYTLWFPFMKQFLPNQMLSFFFNPKFLFIVGNAIIVILIRESKLTSLCSSLATEIYDEYVERSRNQRGHSVLEDKKNEDGSREDHHKENMYEGDRKKVEQKMDDGHCFVEEKREEEEEEEEEEVGLPAEELNRRVEDYIARVNKRRGLEEKLLEFGVEYAN